MVIMVEHRRSLAGLIAGLVARLTGTIVMVRAINIGICIRMVLVCVPMLVMPKMMRLTLQTFMQAVRLHGSPDGLERQQHQQENGNQATHDKKYIGKGAQKLTPGTSAHTCRPVGLPGRLRG